MNLRMNTSGLDTGAACTVSVVVDIDGTLIDISERLRAAMSLVLDRSVLLDDVRSMTTSQLYETYATEEQREHLPVLHERLWNLLLCEDELGFSLLRHDVPIPYAAEVLESWSTTNKVAYLTGRLDTTREDTLRQLEGFGFPVDNTELIMFERADYSGARVASVGPRLIDVRSKLFSAIARNGPVLMVVDDFPGYFEAYRRHDVPDLIGFRRFARRPVQSYIDNGATSVIGCWSELSNMQSPPP